MTSGRGLSAGALLLVAGSRLLAAEPSAPRLEIPFIDVEPRLEDFTGMTLPPRLAGRMARVADFIQREPDDGAKATYPTEVHLAYDTQHLYAIFIAFDDEPEKIRANMAPRGDVFRDDSVNIMLDTFNDQRRAYFFLATPLGIQSEGQFIEGSGFDGSFDAVWDAEGRLTDRGFIVKIKIPFLSLRFPDADEQIWRVIFNRTIPRLSEDAFWPRYTLAIDGRLNQTALMTGIRGISPGRNVQLAPFVFFRDFRVENDDPTGAQVRSDNEESIGLDAKIVLDDALVLDLTANPDFSQVESDEPQVTVNERFELFFPERRPFFLENADLFQTPTNLLFTRRIVDPDAGVKLTGKQGAWTVAALVANDAAPGREAEPGDPLEGESAGVAALRVSRDVSAQSKIGLMLTDRELARGHNRVGAIDGRLKLGDNWVTEFQVAASGTRVLDEADPTAGYETLDGVSYNVFANRTGKHFTSHTHYLYTGPGFRTLLGFLDGGMQRPDTQNLHTNLAYRFRPADSPITEWGPRLSIARVLDTGGQRLDQSITPAMEWRWSGGTRFEIEYEHEESRLEPDEFATLTAPRDYSENRWALEFRTDRFTRVSFGAEVEAGTRINFVPTEGSPPELADFARTEANLLWRPIPSLKIDVTYFRTELDERRGPGGIFTNSVGRARVNWQFTKELSLRLIGDLEETDPVSGATSLPDEKRLVVDAIVRYVWNPWTALYVGYTSSRRDILELDGTSGMPFALVDRGEQVFVKFSYLFQL